jgi:nucleotide-binding universal stress UspA family protein
MRRELTDHGTNRFQPHVAFDSLIGDATRANTPSLTLNVRHKGYQILRHSRTFMAGVDENDYSDYALQWLLDELVDDGDEVVCVRVVEKDFRPGDHKMYLEEAKAMIARIESKNRANKAISLVLEYTFGKLASTFQKMIRMYQPGMLIVGTRGRSLGGIQSLVNTRNSFSKYCLQYSPVPVVVVRPPEKRTKKKDKRSGDPMRQTYTRMLSSTGGRHETDVESTKLYVLEDKLSADEEAHHVARVLGLPASFDPTLKPIDPIHLLRHGTHVSGTHTSLASSTPANSRQAGVGAGSSVTGSVPPSPTGTAPGDSDEENEDDDDDDEGEFEVMSGQQALELMSEHKKERLHEMEVNEAAALKSHGVVEDEDD